MGLPLMPTLHIRLLGDFYILHGEAPVPGVDNPRLQSLLAYLLLHRDAPQARAHLSYLFWLDSTETQARANLRKQLYHLRRSLPDADCFLYADSKVLYWQPDAPFTLDVADFEAAVDRVEEAEHAGDQAGLQGALEQAVATYHGDLLPSCYDDWVLTDAQTGMPIQGATVTLHRVPEAWPDTRTATQDCRTIETRPGGVTGTFRLLYPVQSRRRRAA